MKILISIIFGFLVGIPVFGAEAYPPRFGLTLGVNSIGIYAEKKLVNTTAMRVGAELVNAISPGITAGISFNPKVKIFRKLYLEGSLNYSRFFHANSSYEIDNVFLTYHIQPGHYFLPQLELALYSGKGNDIERDQFYNLGKIHLYFGRTFFLDSVSITEENNIYSKSQYRALEKRYKDRFVIGFTLTFPMNSFSRKK